MKQINYITSPSEAAAVTNVRQGYVNEFADPLIAWTEMTPESTHLDVPCGAGGMMQAIREKGYMGLAYMADINPAMLAAAQQALPERAEFVETDAANIANVIPEGIDSITSLNGFHIYIDEKKAFLSGCHQLLRPGGKMVFDVSTLGLNHPSRTLLDRHDELMREGAAVLGSEVHLPPHASQSDLDRYAEMAQGAGFTVVNKHLVEKVISMGKFEDDTVQIPGRLRSRFPDLSDEQRVGLFLSSSAQAQAETGHTDVLHSRVFYELQKPA